MKLFEVIAVSLGRSIYKYSVIAGNDVEAKRIVEEESGVDIHSFRSVTEVDMSYPCLLCEEDITDL